MAFNPGYYMRQEQVDAQTTRVDNPNVVGSGYINFGAMERLPASEALASNWQFAAGAADEPQVPLAGAGAFGLPLVSAGAEWAAPTVPRAAPAPPSAADRSSNWRDRGRAFGNEHGAPSLDAFAPPVSGHEQAFGAPGLLSTAGSMGIDLNQPVSHTAPLSTHMHGLSLGAPPLASAMPIVSSAFPSALTVLPQSMPPSAVGACYLGASPAVPLGALGGFLSAGQCGASCGASAHLSAADAAMAADPYSLPPYAPAMAANGLGAMASSVAASQRTPMPADARRPAAYGGAASVTAGAQAPRALLGEQAAKAALGASYVAAQPPLAELKKPLTQEDYAAAAKAWKPPKPSTVLVSPTMSKAAPAAGQQPKASGPKEWACKRCSLINDGRARFCEICNYDHVGGDAEHGHDDGWKSTAPRGSGSGAPEQQGPLKSRASAKNEKRRAKKADKQ
ncbi:hypothetical protein KFE25_007072 [Diacronema lutheri]|uniref:RanBP2-type domain-containing protein n=1 Tax=Diacronema lutheri TaxID=2081491 RepID=A0A8J6CFH2_DIALT|nr:hypothetical protein KFE25_007072 [Diacronema lutheri]|mmetsp:Transcript_6091/g.19114  ORF Transcript_6091/g.19114 Transcript_6091/m.19114 type:complete len:450 (-) Transcript_6091:37-1386(-)